MSDSGKPSHSDTDSPPDAPLRRGWTTGTCAAAATRAACQALFGGGFPDPVAVALPNGTRPSFALALRETGDGWARAGVVKDAGDDPDVTHGALIVATVSRGLAGSGVTFSAGPGVGTVTRAGLPIPPGEPAINPVPRAMIREAVREAAELFGETADIAVEISIPGGEKIAERTLNARLGVIGGLSILGTTGIVVPYSCAAWIDTIHRGIDVARAAGLTHIAGATGAASEAAVAREYNLPDIALVDMGNFVGGMLKYLKTHPVPRVTVAGGFAKMSKLAGGTARSALETGARRHSATRGLAAGARGGRSHGSGGAGGKDRAGNPLAGRAGGHTARGPRCPPRPAGGSRRAERRQRRSRYADRFA